MSENIKQGFETWKENNPECLRVDTITDPKYLENRLWHAYHGGLNERGAELDAAQESLRAERIMRDKMKSEVESLTNSLRIERLECDRLRKELERLREASQTLLNVIGFGFAQKEMFAKEYLQVESLLLKSLPLK